jgi:hypothetical protein
MSGPFDLDSIQIDSSLSLPSLITSIEEQISDAKLEFGFAFNSKGEVVVKKVGKADRIRFTHDEIVAMKDCTLTHNHPRKNFFSKEDIRYACLTNLHQIRVVAGKTVYILTRPIGGWSIRKFDTTLAKELGEIWLGYREGLISEATADKRLTNLVQYVVRKLSLGLSAIQLSIIQR